MTTSILKIYNASAGSGKTNCLAQNYLYILLQSDNKNEFTRILCLTFTNKSSEELKDRILQCIKYFAKNTEYTTNKEYDSWKKNLKNKLNLTDQELEKRSKKILLSILNDFSSFSVQTIDKFTYHIIQSFFVNKKFNLEINTNEFLLEVSEQILYKLNYYNTTKQVNNFFLKKYSLEKLQSGKNWDIKLELMKILKLIVKEIHYLPMIGIKKQSTKDWINLKNTLLYRTTVFENECKKQGNKFINFLTSTSIINSSLYYKLIPKFLKNICNIKKSPIIVFEKIENHTLYNKNANVYQKQLINKYQSHIIDLYKKAVLIYKLGISSYIIDKLILKNLNLFILIDEIEKELVLLKEDKKILLNEELNQILYNHIIKNIVPPIIYEKIGTQYKHYLIDEFQDISYLQWQNIKILIENTLSENGTVIIVGDPKQSIYRFRGGDSKSFFNLLYTPSKYYHKKIFYIKTNFRSFEEIVKFNNFLYYSISNFFQSSIYNKIYKTSTQKIFKKPGGYVKLYFIGKTQTNHKKYVYEHTEKIINNLLKNKYNLSDIAILVRKNEEGYFLYEQLIKNGFYVNTNVSFLLKNSIDIKIIIHIFYLYINPNCIKHRIAIILLLLMKKQSVLLNYDIHDFIKKILHLPLNLYLINIINVIIKSKINKIFFNLDTMYNKSLYYIAEKIIDMFDLLNSNNKSFIYSFLNFIHKSKKIIGNSMIDFLEYWEYKKCKISITYTDNINAIRVMTIHKSKGLQFPIVILPFADWKITSKLKEGIWININPKLYHGLDKVYLEINSNLETYIKTHYDSHLCNLYEDSLYQSQFENTNLLYVATTRAIEKLFIFSKQDDKSVYFYLKTLLKEQKMWNKNKFHYSFGNIK
ncbi:UvrD-helicase domain-containing protein [Blattabacterium cuenoti]|uniref:UvrD-helicase domain-containing protein n=1 Tax=Blattabacterium cuenoti TaxID=1653831 RepID=UPI001EECCA19|nr:UvrD-helicase domain-containing protein [Blattabacterium cuenoti]